MVSFHCFKVRDFVYLSKQRFTSIPEPTEGFRNFYSTIFVINLPLIAFSDKDPGPQFINPETQKLLKSITRLDFEMVFRKRTVPKNDVEYK